TSAGSGQMCLNFTFPAPLPPEPCALAAPLAPPPPAEPLDPPFLPGLASATGASLPLSSAATRPTGNPCRSDTPLSAPTPGTLHLVRGFCAAATPAASPFPAMLRIPGNSLRH